MRAYLRACGRSGAEPDIRVRNASRTVHGGNVGWVLREFAREVRACRQRQSTRAASMLIVVVDADQHLVEERRQQLLVEPPIGDSDPVVVLIPKRHIETWIRAALGGRVDELADYKRPVPKKAEVRGAAGTIHDWARNAPPQQSTCVPSLREALPHWRQIG